MWNTATGKGNQISLFGAQIIHKAGNSVQRSATLENYNGANINQIKLE